MSSENEAEKTKLLSRRGLPVVLFVFGMVLFALIFATTIVYLVLDLLSIWTGGQIFQLIMLGLFTVSIGSISLAFHLYERWTKIVG